MERPYKKLDLWNVAMEIVFDTYKITKDFPAHERYGLIDQLRRAAVSVPSNIAEGSSRNTKKEFTNFLYMAQGSLNEIDTQLEIAKGLEYVTDIDLVHIQEKMDRVGKMITGLIKKQKAVE
ncbi:MAG TPA: four helix bundle protein [Syntrophorhabdaceae bacterium]|nr:four helix bundle protein [Syntrophorhabdaceae bacterium]HQM82483.1 four helix bundle protein [Syntrophorhabdaceae bacterium]